MEARGESLASHCRMQPDFHHGLFCCQHRSRNSKFPTLSGERSTRKNPTLEGELEVEVEVEVEVAEYACHKRAKSRDYVFTEYGKR